MRRRQRSTTPDGTRESSIGARFQTLIEKIRAGQISEAEVSREAEFLGEKHRGILYSEMERSMRFGDDVEAAVASMDIESLAVLTGARINDYLNQLFERGDEAAALELAYLYDEYLLAQADTIKIALEVGEDPAAWVSGDLEHIMSEAEAKGLIGERERSLLAERDEFTDWSDIGITLQTEPGGGKLAGTVVAGDVVSYTSAISAETYIVESSTADGFFDVYVAGSPEAEAETPAGFEGIGVIPVPEPAALMARWEAGLVSTQQDTRTEMRSIAQRTIEMYG